MREETTVEARDHAAAVRLCLQQLADPKRRCLESPSELAAIGFKAVHARGVTGVQRVDDRVLSAMEAYADVAPAHNPPYVAAMRLLSRELPEIPLIAAFETGFHETIAPAERLYAVPLEWATKHGVQRWGFHGASHRYIAGRTAQLLNKPEREDHFVPPRRQQFLVRIEEGVSVASSLGMSPQSGLPHNNRVGDFDVFALPAADAGDGQDAGAAARRPGQPFRPARPERPQRPARHRGGGGPRRVGVRHGPGRVRGVGAALPRRLPAAAGRGRRHRLHRRHRRELVADARGRLRDLGWFGIALDPVRNQEAKGEAPIHDLGSRVQIWIMPTNEELVVARQAKALLEGQ